MALGAAVVVSEWLEMMEALYVGCAAVVCKSEVKSSFCQAAVAFLHRWYLCWRGALIPSQSSCAHKQSTCFASRLKNEEF